MRLLARNMVELTRVTTEKREPILTEDGLNTGEFKSVTETETFKGTVVPASSDILTQVFGQVNDSAYVIYTHKTLNIGDTIVYDEFGEETNFRLTYRKPYLNHNVYGITYVK